MEGPSESAPETERASGAVRTDDARGRGSLACVLKQRRVVNLHESEGGNWAFVHDLPPQVEWTFTKTSALTDYE